MIIYKLFALIHSQKTYSSSFFSTQLTQSGFHKRHSCIHFIPLAYLSPQHLVYNILWARVVWYLEDVHTKRYSVHALTSMLLCSGSLSTVAQNSAPVSWSKSFCEKHIVCLGFSIMLHNNVYLVSTFFDWIRWLQKFFKCVRLPLLLCLNGIHCCHNPVERPLQLMWRWWDSWWPWNCWSWRIHWQCHPWWFWSTSTRSIILEPLDVTTVGHIEFQCDTWHI